MRLAVAMLILSATAASSSEFRQLDGAAIKAKISGHELTDKVHWRFTFRHDGSLPSTSLGRERVGRWWIAGDRLCMTQGIGGDECYAVWVAGPSVQLRPDNDAVLTEEGTLEPVQGSR